MTAAARTNSPRPQFMQRCSVTVAQIRLLNGLRDAIYTNNLSHVLPQKCARTSSLPLHALGVRGSRPPSLPACAPRAQPVPALPLRAQRALCRPGKPRPTTGVLRVPWTGLYGLVPATSCAVLPRHKRRPRAHDPCLRHWPRPTGLLLQSSTTTTTALRRILQRFVIWGRLPHPRLDKDALAQSATALVPPDIPRI